MTPLLEFRSLKDLLKVLMPIEVIVATAVQSSKIELRESSI